MRTTIDIREDLMEEAMRLTKAKTKKEVINFSLEELIRRRRIQSLIEWIGSGEFGLTREEYDRMEEKEIKELKEQFKEDD